MKISKKKVDFWRGLILPILSSPQPDFDTKFCVFTPQDKNKLVTKVIFIKRKIEKMKEKIKKNVKMIEI